MFELVILAIYWNSITVNQIELRNNVVVENDVLVGISLPQYGVLCEDTQVWNAPAGTAVLYELNAGQIVELREQPRFHNRDWVMIAPGEWIPLKTVCK